MIKIQNTTNNTLTITDTETKNVFMVLGTDCEIRVYDASNMYAPISSKKRTVGIFNKYNKHTIAIVDNVVLDPSSSGYTSDMDAYAVYLRDFGLFV